jgi:APA family basic amino acid/polyamine antiporter
MADTAPTAPPRRFTLEVELSRDLGLLSATSVIIGGIIGSGIFGAPAGIAQQLQSPGLFMLVWVVGGILSFCGAVCFAELGALLPRTGGQFIYLREVYPPIVAFIYGWTEAFLIQTASMSAIAYIFATYASFFFPAISIENALFTIAGFAMSTQHALMILILVFLGTVNYFGVRFGGFIANVFTISKVVALAGLVLIVAFAGGDWGHFSPFFPENPPSNLISAFGAAMIGAMFAYNGWHNANMVAGEIRDPQRLLPRAIFIGLFIVLAVYLSVNWSYLYVLSVGEVANSSRIAADVAERVIGPVGGVFISLAVMVSTFGTINNGMLATPRVSYAMAKEGLFFKSITYVHPRYKTPSHAILIITLSGIIWTFLGDFQKIIDAFAWAMYTYYTLTIIGLFTLRRKYPDIPRPVKAWGYPVTPILFILISTVYVFSVLYEKPWESLPGLLFVAVGLAVYAVYYWTNRGTEKG